MNPEILCIGSALIDIFVQSPEFSLQPSGEGLLLCSRYGDKLEISDFHLLTGGGAGNTAVGFARRGWKTAVIAEMGRDIFGDQVQTELEKELVDVSLLVREKREQTGMSVVLVSPDGGRTVMVHRGAASLLEDTDVSWTQIKPRWVHLSSIAGQELLLQEIFEQQEKQGFGLSWTPGKKELEVVTKPGYNLEQIRPTVLLLNKQEWDFLEPVTSHFHNVCTYIVVTDGRNGGEVYAQGEVVHTYQIETTTPPVDETGAGDAFAVGFVDGYLCEKSVEQCCEDGKKNAASVVQQFGAKAGLLGRE